MQSACPLPTTHRCTAAQATDGTTAGPAGEQMTADSRLTLPRRTSLDGACALPPPCDALGWDGMASLPVSSVVEKDGVNAAGGCAVQGLNGSVQPRWRARCRAVGLMQGLRCGSCAWALALLARFTRLPEALQTLARLHCCPRTPLPTLTLLPAHPAAAPTLLSRIHAARSHAAAHACRCPLSPCCPPSRCRPPSRRAVHHPPLLPAGRPAGAGEGLGGRGEVRAAAGRREGGGRAAGWRRVCLYIA